MHACMRVCACVCVCVCVCVRAYMCMFMHWHMCAHTDGTCLNLCACVHTGMYACTWVHVCACMHAHMGACMRVGMCAAAYTWARTRPTNNPVAISTKLRNNQHSPTWNDEFSPHLLWIFLQQTARDDQSLNFAGSLIDLRDASVAIIPLSWHIIHVAHPTKDLDRLHVHRKLQYSKREHKERNSVANSSSWDWILMSCHLRTSTAK